MALHTVEYYTHQKLQLSNSFKTVVLYQNFNSKNEVQSCSILSFTFHTHCNMTFCLVISPFLLKTISVLAKMSVLVKKTAPLLNGQNQIFSGFHLPFCFFFIERLTFIIFMFLTDKLFSWKQKLISVFSTFFSSENSKM